MKKDFTLYIALTALILSSIQVVRGGWSDPTQTAPGGNVAAPMTASPAFQYKPGKIAAQDVWSDQASAWLADFHQVKYLNTDSTTWPNGYHVLGLTSLSAATPWTVINVSDTSTYSLVQPGKTAKALIVRVYCGQAEVFVTKEVSPAPITNNSFGTPNNDGRKVCSAFNNQRDTNDAVVPVEVVSQGAINTYQFKYKIFPTNAPGLGVDMYVIGAYY